MDKQVITIAKDTKIHINGICFFLKEDTEVYGNRSNMFYADMEYADGSWRVIDEESPKVTTEMEIDIDSSVN